MKIFDYLKERWISFLFLFIAFIFSFMVYNLDGSFNIRESNAHYILMAWGFIFIVFVVLDYNIFSAREKNFREYCQLNGSKDNFDAFSYPSDMKKAVLFNEMTMAYERYKAENDTKSAEEMDFITKWLHDIKVPISASKLILETHQDNLPVEFYRNMYSEIFSIEESIMQVFYEMKSNRIFDDYKIVKTSTKKLISQALKNYSSFFSYKKLNLVLGEEDYKIVTDEKWSAYVLSQIISNAVKYSRQGSTIEIETKKESGKTTISIKNQGEGITQEDIGQIFKKGYTSSREREGANSTGYGLYLSKKLCDLLGHQLKAQSKQGEYAMFTITFFENDTIQNLNS